MKNPSDNARHSRALGMRLSEALKTHSALVETEAAVRWADALLADAMEARASDIHFDPREDLVMLRFRIDGVLQDLNPLQVDSGERLTRYFKTNAGFHSGSQLGPEDAHFEFASSQGPVDVRVACAPCLIGEKMTLRLLPRSRIQIGLEEIGLSARDLACVRGWLGEVTGVFLITGPTGSGKTTTLHAILREMILAGSCVVTIEDPIEYRAAGANQIEVDETTDISFESGLKAALRLDPDHIMLGEIRDRESAKVALQAAGTGHAILASMHGRNAAAATTMLRNFDLTDHEIATSLAFVVSQRLVRVLCSECKREGSPDGDDKRLLHRMGIPVPERLWTAVGCERCQESGYLGRTGIFELWPFDEASYDLVIEGEDEHGIRDHLRKSGVRTLFQDGLDKAAKGITSMSELRRLGILNRMWTSSGGS
jgi:general secretion pathway protein E